MSSINKLDFRNISSNVTNPQDQQERRLSQINVADLQKSSQSELLSTSLNQTNEMMPVAIINDPENSNSREIGDVCEHKIWSIFNLLFCCFIIGIFALSMSCTTRKKKRDGDYLGAKNSSKLTALINVTGTFSGILILILGLLRFTGDITV